MAKHKSHQKTMLGFGGVPGPASSPPDEGPPAKEAPAKDAPAKEAPAKDAPAKNGGGDKPRVGGALLGGKPAGRKRGGALLSGRKGGALLGSSKTKIGGSSETARADDDERSEKPTVPKMRAISEPVAGGQDDDDDDKKADNPTVPKMRVPARPMGASKTKIGGSGLSAGADLLKKLSSSPPAAAEAAAKGDDLDWGGDDADIGEAAAPAEEAAPVEAIGIIPVVDIGEPMFPPDEESDGLGLLASAVVDASQPGAKDAPVEGDAPQDEEVAAAPPEAAQRPSGARGSTPDLDDLFADLPLEDAGETPAPVAPLPEPVDEPASVIEPPMKKTSSALWLIAAGGAVALGGLGAYFLLGGSSDETAAASPEPTASAVQTSAADTAATAAAATSEPSASAAPDASASASASASATASAPTAKPPSTKPPAARPPWWKREDIYE